MLKFHKYHGTGNDFIMIDNREGLLSGEEADFFKKWCTRRFGVGADGLILLNKGSLENKESSKTDFNMDYFNADGNRSTMCGNGGRCIVAFAKSLGIIESKAKFMAIDGLHEAQITDEGVRLKMTLPTAFKLIAGKDYFIDTGSPHYVRFQDEKISQMDVFHEGRMIRSSGPWLKEGVNVNFVNIGKDGSLNIRTYERGVENETFSCGTGVTAAAEVAFRLGFLKNTPTQNTLTKVKVSTLGGELFVHVSNDQAPWLEGPATFVYEGHLTLLE